MVYTILSLVYLTCRQEPLLWHMQVICPLTFVIPSLEEEIPCQAYFQYIMFSGPFSLSCLLKVALSSHAWSTPCCFDEYSYICICMWLYMCTGSFWRWVAAIVMHLEVMAFLECTKVHDDTCWCFESTDTWSWENSLFLRAIWTYLICRCVSTDCYCQKGPRCEMFSSEIATSNNIF